MAEKISVQIALEGGREIARQLESIGEAGQKAFVDISRSAEQVGFKNIKPDEVTAALEKFGVEGSAAINKVTAAVRQAARLETIVRGVQSAETAMVALGRAALVAGPIIAAAFVAASKATIAFADTINKASDQAVKLGLSLEQFTQQRKGLEALGLSTQQAADGMARFQQQMAKAIAEAEPGSQLAAFGNAVQMTQQQMGPFIERLRQMPDGIERTNLAIQNFGQQAGTALIQGMRAAEGSMSATELKAYQLGQAIQRLQQAWEGFGSVALAPAITPQLNAITSALEGVQTMLTTTSWSEWGSAGAQAAMGIVNAINPLPGLIQRIIQALASFDWSKLNPSGGTGGEAGAIPGIASGGVIGGRGTGTSDSNLAWVSRGEHIMPARAVAQPGVLAFLEALRRSGGNLRNVLDGMGRFAVGGLVPRPAYAGGGAVGSMSHVTINFPGLPPIAGLRASARVVDQLQKAAALAQVRSGGRKPSRYS